MSEMLRIDVPVAGSMIACRVHLPGRAPAPVLVCCHGLLSHKDSSKYRAVGELMSTHGMAVVRFDFSGCGESPSRGGALLENRLTDLRGVLDHVLEQAWSNTRVALLGSSMGGYLTLLLAATGHYPIESLICWATPFALDKVRAAVEGSKELRRRLGGFEGFGGPLDLSGLPALQGALVLHGQRDETVPWWDGVQIYRRLGEPRRLLLMESGDHRLTDPGMRRLALRASLDWLRESGFAEDVVVRSDSNPSGCGSMR